MEAKGGRVEVTDTDLDALLGKLMYRKASYMSNIRRRAGIEVRAIRNGRKVVAYELVASAGSSATVAAAPIAAPAAVENV